MSSILATGTVLARRRFLSPSKSRYIGFFRLIRYRRKRMLVPGVRRSVLFLLPLLTAVPNTASAACHRGEPARARGVAWVGSAQPGFLNKRRELLAATAPASAIIAASLLGRQVRSHQLSRGSFLRDLGGGYLAGDCWARAGDCSQHAVCNAQETI